MTAIPAHENDTFRPAIHYTAKNTWLNDPNGLVYHEGIYHLYYQNNRVCQLFGVTGVVSSNFCRRTGVRRR